MGHIEDMWDALVEEPRRLRAKLETLRTELETEKLSWGRAQQRARIAEAQVLELERIRDEAQRGFESLARHEQKLLDALTAADAVINAVDWEPPICTRETTDGMMCDACCTAINANTESVPKLIAAYRAARGAQ